MTTDEKTASYMIRIHSLDLQEFEKSRLLDKRICSVGSPISLLNKASLMPFNFVMEIAPNEYYKLPGKRVFPINEIMDYVLTTNSELCKKPDIKVFPSDFMLKNMDENLWSDKLFKIEETLLQKTSGKKVDSPKGKVQIILPGNYTKIKTAELIRNLARTLNDDSYLDNMQSSSLTVDYLMPQIAGEGAIDTARKSFGFYNKNVEIGLRRIDADPKYLDLEDRAYYFENSVSFVTG